MRIARAVLSVLVIPLKMEQTGRVTKATPQKSSRGRRREKPMGEILEIAHGYLGTVGAAGISLRAIARDMGMVSSGIYRYVETRDALLTLLITDAYTSLGAAAERSEKKIPRRDRQGRFLAIAHATRNWALNHPHEYALIFGTPVPGYKAPEATIAPASIIPLLLTEILRDTKKANQGKSSPKVSELVSSSISPLQKSMGQDLPADLVLRGLNVWSSLFGTISFEIFGHTHNVVSSDSRKRKAYFDHQMRTVVQNLNLI